MTSLRSHTNWSYTLGYWTALALTLFGIAYLGVIVYAFLGNEFTYPPPEWLQLFAGIFSLVFCPVFVIMMACMQAVMPSYKHALSQASLGFTLLFALSVSINRFSQLGVVRLAETAGQTESISWFQAYGNHSIMLGLEYLGWAWFLGLAMLCAAPLFHGGPVRRWLRRLMLLYALLGALASIGFLTDSPLSLLGFVDWGVVLVIITALMAVFFQRAQKRRNTEAEDETGIETVKRKTLGADGA